MLIKKIFNNNVLLAEDKQQDIVVIGRGIGFQKKRGDAVEEALIDTRYLPQDEHWGRTFNDLASEISPLFIEMASNILRHAEAQLHTTFNTYLLVSLADHISYAIEKAKQQIVVHNNLLWETRHYYPMEYQIGEWAVATILEQTGVALPDDEAGFIALKFVDKQNGYLANERASQITTLISDALTIIRYAVGQTIDENDINYQRLLVHLRFFLDRLYDEENRMGNANIDAVMLQHVQRSYPKAYDLADKVIVYIEDKTHKQVAENERIYLTVHLNRVLQSTLAQ
ncbi:PRD domain-containing protein [Weissella cibaria]|uniref:PRD domain-containing protein n=1 Tax=Weissella cibaria TaxID=137591 RepID=UPI001131DFD0|nr:PRD domain-containing protein [Weissella cibaria]QDG81520.1 PRD domain-containing protein [Weissella cibaria]